MYIGTVLRTLKSAFIPNQSKAHNESDILRPPQRTLRKPFGERAPIQIYCDDFFLQTCKSFQIFFVEEKNANDFITSILQLEGWHSVTFQGKIILIFQRDEIPNRVITSFMSCI